MVFRLYNTWRRQNEAIEGKKIKEWLLWKEIKKRNLVTHNNVSITMPCREFYMSCHRIHTTGLGNVEETSYCIYWRRVIILVIQGNIWEFSFQIILRLSLGKKKWLTFSGKCLVNGNVLLWSHLMVFESNRVFCL